MPRKSKDPVDKLKALLFGVKPNEFALLRGMANYESFDSEGWQVMKEVCSNGNFKSQINNFPKYFRALLQKGLAEEQDFSFQDNRKRIVSKKRYRLRRDRATFERIFAIFYEQGGWTSKYIQLNYFRYVPYLMQFINEELHLNLNEKIPEKFNRVELFSKLYFYFISNKKVFRQVVKDYHDVLIREGVPEKMFFEAFTMPFAFSSFFDGFIQDRILQNLETSVKEQIEDIVSGNKNNLAIIIKLIKKSYNYGGKKLKNSSGV